MNINDSIFRIIRKKLFKNLLIIFKIKKIIKQERIDLIYGTTIVNIVPILTGLISNKNTIWHIHEQCNKYSDVYSKKIDFLMRYFFKKANIVYISETMKKIWKERIKLKDTLNEYVIYNPIKSEIEFFEKKESKSFGFAGTFYELKNIPLFLEGINELQKEIPDIKIELCGHGMKRGVEKIIKEKKIKLNNLIVNDYIEINKFFRKINYLVLPSFQEAWPLVVLEAMQVGVIPIVTNQSGLPEIFEDKKNIFYFNPYSKEELKEVIKDVLKLENTKKQIIKANINKLNKYNFNDNFNKKLVELIEKS